VIIELKDYLMRKKTLLFIIGLIFLLVIPAQAQDVTFGEIIFARDISLQGNEPITVLTRFPNTVPVIVAIVDIQGLQQGATVSSQWLLNGTQQTASAYTHNSTERNFRLWTNLANPNGMSVGTWTLRMLLNGAVVQTGTFEVTDAPFVFPIQFGAVCGNFSGEMYGHTSNYENGTQNIYAQVRYTNFPQGTEIEGVWSHNGEVLQGAGLPIVTTLTGGGQRCFRVGDPRGLASGEYTFAIRNAGNTLASSDVTVGTFEPEFNNSGE
jgi:hypothetical protein